MQEHEKNDGFAEISSDILTRNDIEIRSLERSDLSALNHFLITGNAPWWISTSTKGMRQILSEENILSLLERQSTILQLEQLFKLQPLARKRWVYQFNTTLQLAMFQRLTINQFQPSEAQKKYIVKFIESPIFTSIPVQEQQKMWFALLTAATQPERLHSPFGKIEIVEHIVSKFVVNSSSEVRKKLNETIAEIVQKKNNNADPIGTLPPILIFALSLVVELSAQDQKEALRTVRKTQQASFEVIDSKSPEFKWVTSSQKSIQDLGNSSKLGKNSEDENSEETNRKNSPKRFKQKQSHRKAILW